MIVKTLIAAALCIGLVACAGQESEKIDPMQKRDKNLSCREILLEQNEAEFYRSTAEKNKTPGVKSLLMPLGYVSTYMNAEDAVQAANARVDYLSRIYDILDCGNKLEMANRKNAIATHQMAASMEDREEDAPVAAPSAQPMMQPVPQGYVLVPAPTMQPQRMSYQPPQYYVNPMDMREDAGRYVTKEAYGPTF